MMFESGTYLRVGPHSLRLEMDYTRESVQQAKLARMRSKVHQWSELDLVFQIEFTKKLLGMLQLELRSRSLVSSPVEGETDTGVCSG